MTREEFMVIFNDYFKNAKHKKDTNPKALFCAFCDYKKYKATTPKPMRISTWFSINNVPKFGYDADTKPHSAAPYYWDKLSVLCKGESFLEFVPSWKEVTEPPKLDIIPPKKTTGITEFMAQMMLDMKEIKLMLRELINTEKNHRSLAGAILDKMNEASHD